MPTTIRHGSKASSFTKTGKSLLQTSADAHLDGKSGRAIGHFVTKSEQDREYLPANRPFRSGGMLLRGTSAAKRLFRTHYSKTKAHGGFENSSSPSTNNGSPRY